MGRVEEMIQDETEPVVDHPIYKTPTHILTRLREKRRIKEIYEEDRHRSH